jgi:rhodanese-related sulfurtransferase
VILICQTSISCARFVRCGAAILLLWSCLASAQSGPGNRLPEALKDIKQADALCRGDNVTASAKNVKSQITQSDPDLSCAASVAKVKTWSNRADTIVVDTRPVEEYEGYHLDNSVNISIVELRSKPYWRKKMVVLLGSGKADRELYIACAMLKKQGYKNVQVLRGGVAVWVAARQLMAGNVPRARQLSRLNAAELWQESRFTNNIMLVTSSQASLLQELPSSVALQRTNATEIKTAMRRMKKKSKKVPVASVILVAGLREISETQFGQLRQALDPVPLLIYEDTKEEYVRQIGLQKAVWAAQARGPKQPGCGL